MVVLAPGGPLMSRRVYLSHLDMPKGDFRYWPKASLSAMQRYVRSWGQSRLESEGQPLDRRGLKRAEKYLHARLPEFYGAAEYLTCTCSITPRSHVRCIGRSLTAPGT